MVPHMTVSVRPLFWPNQLPIGSIFFIYRLLIYEEYFEKKIALRHRGSELLQDASEPGLLICV